MGLFDKKYCDVCGDKIGLLGNRKLEDGNLCKNCARKLSPWFSDRRNSTVAEIKAQLEYREANREKVAQFHTTKSFGEDWRVLIDETHLWLMVTRGGNLAEENPDVIDFSALTDCTMDVDESRTELKRDVVGRDGKRTSVSYNPPRYEFSYDFNIIIRVNTPYFTELKFQLNRDDVRLVSELPSGGLFGASRGVSIDPSYNVDYRRYMRMAEELCDEMRKIRSTMADLEQLQKVAGPNSSLSQADMWRIHSQQAPLIRSDSVNVPPAYAAAAAAAPAAVAPAAGPWICPACGAPNSGRFCESCGSPRPQ